MVSRILKKTPSTNKPMPIKLCRGIRRRHRRNCCLKKSAIAPSTVVLTRVGTNKAFKVLHKPQSPETRPETQARLPLPPLASPEKRTVCLDLDETLVHSVTGPPPKNFDFVVQPKVRGKVMTFYVVKRPGVDAFLERLAAQYEVVVFTAGLRDYATLVLDRLDRKRLVSHRLYRDSCKEMSGKFVKDLSRLGRDLRRVVIVDDNPNAYFLQPENAIPVRRFFYDPADRELERLLEFFEDEELRCCEDIRVAVKKFVGDDGLMLSDDDDDDDDELEEMSDAKSKPTVSTPCSVISVHRVGPVGPPVLEWGTNMVIVCSFFLLIINVIVCFPSLT
ncbi:carboxy-terminal domain RNA polymerase II polypeptide A small phosphatase 1-like [Prunus dulcis]|uniref:carboxy-terminal domain RNA polymerase II polypeptide A small phosphatase 1-like n=1 Tax=Prunus dulcis TaxID=3755 RepID=UPI0014827A89|nr:carboxy-terminal domain RNA polymerase II polypeptide A small phosphatase 1-like [Prunus dulcis]